MGVHRGCAATGYRPMRPPYAYGRTRLSQYPGRRLAWATARTRTSSSRTRKTSVREAGEQGPPDLEGRVYVLKPRKGARARSDDRESGLHLVQELASQPLLSGFVPEDRFGQFVRDFRREPDRGHLRVREMRSSIRVRVSSQVSPGRPPMAA